MGLLQQDELVVADNADGGIRALHVTEIIGAENALNPLVFPSSKNDLLRVQAFLLSSQGFQYDLGGILPGGRRDPEKIIIQAGEQLGGGGGADGDEAGIIEKGGDGPCHVAGHGADESGSACIDQLLNRPPGNIGVLLIVLDDELNLAAGDAAGTVARFNQQLGGIPTRDAQIRRPAGGASHETYANGGLVFANLKYAEDQCTRHQAKPAPCCSATGHLHGQYLSDKSRSGSEAPSTSTRSASYRVRFTNIKPWKCICRKGLFSYKLVMFPVAVVQLPVDIQAVAGYLLHGCLRRR
jgi:hypothetical protein